MRLKLRLKIGMCFLLWGMVAHVAPSYACDVCGCRVGGWGTGPLYLPNQHYFSVGYDRTVFQTKIDWSQANEKAGTAYIANSHSTDTYQRMSLTANFAMDAQTRFVVIQPVIYNSQKERGSSEIVLKGLGDGQVRLQRQLLNQSPTLIHNYKQSLLVEAGVEVPFGSFDRRDLEGNRVNENLQTGSESWDLLWGVSYTLRNMTWGLNQRVTYQWNTQNTYAYKRGNQTYSQTSLLYFNEIKRLQYSLAPLFWFEQSQADELSGATRANRGGHSLGTGLQVQVNYGNWVFNTSARQPLIQNFHIEERASISGGTSWGMEVGIFI